MLTCLRVRGLAVVEALELEFGAGLNVVTGETGAGKSILVDALQLVVGGRSQADLVRAGCAEAEVEALFDLRQHPEIRARLVELGGEDEDELVIRRTIRAEGRGRAWINGRLATAGQLSLITGGLVDICSQHEHHTLTDPATHLRYLDAYARLNARRDAVEAAWRRYAEAARALEELARRLRERTEREAVVRFQIDEIQAVDPQAGEWEELEAEHGRLAHADRLATATSQAEDRLYARDGSMVDQLARLAHGLEALRGVDAELDPLIDRLGVVAGDLEDVAREIGRYARGVHADPERLARLDERMAALRRLERRYGGSFDALVAARDRLRQELDAFGSLEGAAEDLEGERDAAADSLVALARELSEHRRDAARRLGGAITAELAALGMGNARIEVDVDRLDARAGGLDLAGVRYSATGMDRVELLIAPNKGEPPKALAKIASGGELSRSLLAVKRVLSELGTAGLYVFDEVDTGVGGGVAEVIGRKLAEVGQHHQVLCITHLPQIAVYGRQHVHVTKEVADGRTRSVATVLAGEHRVEEIARMMGGLHITAATRAAAAELMREAASAQAG